MSPTLKFSPAAVSASMATCCGPCGHWPVLELERAELWQRRVIAESELGRAFGADGLAVAAEDLGVVGLVRRDRAAGRLDLGQRPHLGEQRLGNRRGPALRARDDLLAGDHRVGLLVRRREDAVERLLDRVGQDERPAHHHDADHDGQRRQQGTHLAAEQSLQGDGDHRSVTASSASRISCARRAAEIADDLTVGQEQHAVGDRRRVRVVRDHHRGLAQRVDRVAQQREDLAARRRIEVAGRLVGEHHARARHQRSGDRHALLLTARQLRRAVREAVTEADLLDQLVEPRLRRASSRRA